ncbi:Uncharacterized protein Fot_14149 [Forsythia ovata]|uniref:Uncharacterized protein n=1 Tax=Forsythia ovata TaxID=205694 RepID=A0ABD1W5I9_9LAMI
MEVNPFQKQERQFLDEEEPQSGKRKRTKAIIEEIETLRFQLFKSTIKDKDDEFFILQMHKRDSVVRKKADFVKFLRGLDEDCSSSGRRAGATSADCKGPSLPHLD